MKMKSIYHITWESNKVIQSLNEKQLNIIDCFLKTVQKNALLTPMTIH